MKFAKIIDWITTGFLYIASIIPLSSGIFLIIALSTYTPTYYGNDAVSGWGTIFSTFLWLFLFPLGIIAVIFLVTAALFTLAPAIFATYSHIKYHHSKDARVVYTALIVKGIYLSMLNIPILTTLFLRSEDIKFDVIDIISFLVGALLITITILTWVAFYKIKKIIKSEQQTYITTNPN